MSLHCAVIHNANQIVLAWMHQRKPPLIPIFSASKVEQVRENIAVASLVLAADQMEQLESIKVW